MSEGGHAVPRDQENPMTTEPAPPECGAPLEGVELHGIRCELRPGHHGEHLAWQPVTWRNDAAAVVAGRDPEPVIDIGYLSLPAEVQAAVEQHSGGPDER